MNTEQLRKAAADLNNALGLEPKIGTREPKEELEKKIKKAGKLLEDGDKIEKNTMDVLLELEVDVVAGVKVAKGTSGKTDKKEEPKNKKAETKDKEKPQKKEAAESTNEYGFRAGSASGDTSEYIMKGKSEKETVEMIMDSHGKDERVATGRYKIIERELKKRGFLK